MAHLHSKLLHQSSSTLTICEYSRSDLKQLENNRSDTEALLEVLGNREANTFILGEQRSKGLNFEETGQQKQFWEKWNTENQNFDFREEGTEQVTLLDSLDTLSFKV